MKSSFRAGGSITERSFVEMAKKSDINPMSKHVNYNRSPPGFRFADNKIEKARKSVYQNEVMCSVPNQTHADTIFRDLLR